MTTCVPVFHPANKPCLNSRIRLRCHKPPPPLPPPSSSLPSFPIFALLCLVVTRWRKSGLLPPPKKIRQNAIFSFFSWWRFFSPTWSKIGRDSLPPTPTPHAHSRLFENVNEAGIIFRLKKKFWESGWFKERHFCNSELIFSPTAMPSTAKITNSTVFLHSPWIHKFLF